MSDNVNNPAHYQLHSGRQTIEVLQDTTTDDEIIKALYRENQSPRI